MTTTGRRPQPGDLRAGSPLLRWWRSHVLLVDAMWAAGLLLLSWLLSVAGGTPGTPTQVQALLAVVLLVPLVWRRRAPELVTGLVAVLQYGQVLIGWTDLLAANFFATVSVMFTVTAYGRDRAWPFFLGAALAGCVLFGVLANPDVAVVAGTAVVGATLAGYLRRIVRVRDEAAVERARRLEVERDSAVAVAAEQERRRIARDLHDVIAHSLTVIVAQADGGRYAARADPQAAERSLQTVATTARVALADLRTALGALRAAPGQAETAPLPGAADVPDLVASVRDSGHPVSLTVTGEATAVPPAAGLTAYRVVQESLTNVLKHAGPGVRTSVDVHHGADCVRVTVTDDGVGTASRPDPDGVGTGLAGMRERVAATGGTFRAGPRDGGGWAVAAEIPTGRGTAS